MTTPAEVHLSPTQAIIYIAAAVAVCVLVGVLAAYLGRRARSRAISQRLAALGTRLGLDPPEDENNIEISLAYLESVTGGAAQAVDRVQFGRHPPPPLARHPHPGRRPLRRERHGDLSQRPRQCPYGQPPR